MGRPPVDGDLLRPAMAADRLRQEPLSGLLVPLRGEQTVNGLPALVSRAIELVPVAFPLKVRLGQAPPAPPRARAALQRLCHQGTVCAPPALDRRVVDRRPTRLQQFVDMPIASGIRHLPAPAHAHDIGWAMGPRAADRHRRSPALRPGSSQRESIPQRRPK
jgi:hypothetical protein